MLNKKIYYNYYLILFSLIPVSIIFGPSVSLINILIIDLSFIFFLIFYKKKYYFYKNKAIKYLFLLYFYLIFNSFISLDYKEGILRNIGFLRMIILFIALNYFFKKKFFFRKVILAWSVILLIVVIDVYIESFFGRNIIGYESPYGRRIVSFFKDEPIVGGFIYSFYLIIIGYYFEIKKKIDYKILVLSLIFLFGIFLTGERANSIKALLSLYLFYFFINEINFKSKFIVIISSFILIFLVIKNSPFLNNRFYEQIKYISKNDNVYFQLYRSGYQVFINNKIFGVGNKNYRIETCDNIHNYQYFSQKNYDEYFCSTHPHQIFLEFLSEHGIFGTLLILFIFYKLIFKKVLFIKKDINYIQLATSIFIIMTFLPIIPSGAFFGNYLINLFIINLSIFYSSSKKLNIFMNYKN